MIKKVLMFMFCLFSALIIFFAGIGSVSAKAVPAQEDDFGTDYNANYGTNAAGYLSLGDITSGIEDLAQTIQGGVEQGFNAVSSGLGQAVDYSLCDISVKQIIPIKEYPGAKFNILVVGDINSGYSTPELIKKDVNGVIEFSEAGKQFGLFSLEPFKSNKAKFNIYAVRAKVMTNAISNANPASKALSVWLGNCAAAKTKSSSGKRIDYVVVISKKNFRSFCIPETPCLVSVGSRVTKEDAMVFAHEFGHGFAGLADEYVESGMTEISSDVKSVSKALFGKSVTDVNDFFNIIGIIAPPNCVSPGSYDPISKHKSWGGYWKGCAFLRTNYRPPYDTIMKAHTITSFGSVNEKRISDVINGRVNILKRDSIIKKLLPYK